MFLTENQLVDRIIEGEILKKLGEAMGGINYCEVEPFLAFGIPDLVIANIVQSQNRTVLTSIEVKLNNWRRAMVQAYKYKAFSHYSYVILDHKHIKPALKRINEFQKSNIGLISVDFDGPYTIHFNPESSIPYSPTMFEHIRNLLNSSVGD